MRATIRRLMLLLPLTVVVSPVGANIYQWVDDSGVVHYSSTPPPSAAAREVRLLDGQGHEREVRPAPPTAKERELQAQAEERERQEAERLDQERARQQAEVAAREARMRHLHQAYANVGEIREQRDRRLAMVKNTLAPSESRERILQGERARIAAQIADSRPDSRDLERYHRELSDLDRRIDWEKGFQNRQREALTQIRDSAEADVLDFERFVAPARR